MSSSVPPQQGEAQEEIPPTAHASLPSYRVSSQPRLHLHLYYHHQSAPLGRPNSPHNSAQVNTENSESGGRENLWRHICEIIEKQELGKLILGVAATMVTALVLSSHSLSATTEISTVAVTALCAIAVIWNGILLLKAFPRLSSILVVLGLALMMLTLSLLLSCYVSRELKWVPWLCWIAILFPFILAFVLHTMSRVYPQEKKDLENGQP